MLLKVTVSGDYRTSGKLGSDIVDFEGVVVMMPECHEDFIMPNVQNRLLQIAIKNDKRYTQRFEMFRSVYIDKVEKVDGKPSVVGKNIKELSWEELQELACYKNLRLIPAYRGTDLRYAREVAYAEYSKHILGKEIDREAKGYNFAELPDLFVDGSEKKAVSPKQQTNEEAIKEEQDNSGPGADKTFTLAELKQIAKDKGIKLPANVSYEKAFKLVIEGQK
ncbi:MAG: hypothetical protein WC486_03710 [Candidatus Omnitrophota bacterium]